MLGPQSVDPPLHLLFHLVVLLLVATRIIVVIFTTILLLILSLLSSLLFIRSPGTPPGFQRGSTNPLRYQEKLSSSWIWLDRLPAWLQKSTSERGLGKLTRIWCVPSCYRDDHLTQNHKVERTRSFKIYMSRLPFIWNICVFSCPGQLNKWHCRSVGLSVGRSEPTNNQSLGSIKEWP